MSEAEQGESSSAVQQSNTYNSDSSSDRFGWQIAAEFGTDTTALTMSSSHFTPHDANAVQAFLTWD